MQAQAKLPISTPLFKDTEEEFVQGMTPERIDAYVDRMGNVIKRYGLNIWGRLPAGCVHGLYYWEAQNKVVGVADGRTFLATEVADIEEITDEKLYPNTRVSFADDGIFLYMANGGRIMYYADFLKYFATNLDHPALATVPMDRLVNLNMDNPKVNGTHFLGSETAPLSVTHLATISQYLICNSVGTNKWRWSDVGVPLSMNALNFASAEMKADNIIALHAERDEIVLSGTRSKEFWVETGDDIAPFARQRGIGIDRGTGAVYSITNCDFTWFEIDNERRLCKLSGRTPEIVSASMDKELSALTRIDDCIMDNVIVGGRTFLIMTFPTDNKTFVYDYAIKQYIGQWAYYDSTEGKYSRWRGNCYLYVPQWNKHLVGDISNGIIYEMSDKVFTDGGDIIRTSQRTPYINHGTGNLKRCDRLAIKTKRGQSDFMARQPVCELRYRDDGGDWEEPITVKLGNVGEFNFLAYEYNLGYYVERQWEILHTDNSPFILAELEETFEVMEL